MKAISLFSGIGGFDLAFKRVGIETTAVVERDKACRAVLQRWFPEAKQFDDVCTFGVKAYGSDDVDIICGGFPCQDLSVAGKRAGLAGKRSGLWWQFARIVREFRPRWVVIENVPGLLSSNAGRDFAIILRGLAKRGYCVAWRVFDAQFSGLAQRRERVFIVASLGDGSAAEILFERESLPWNFAPRQTARQVTAALTASGAGTSRTGNERTEASFCVVANTLDARYRMDLDHETYVTAPAVTSKWAKGTGGPSGDEVQKLAAFTPRRTDCGASHSVFPKLNTGTGGFGAPGVANAQAVRRLMPVECERLQGFPDGWTSGQSDSARYSQIGNAVAVPVVEWIARRIAEKK